MSHQTDTQNSSSTDNAPLPTGGSLVALMRTRRFLPLFLTQFLGALNDNLFKTALVTLVLFRLADANGGALGLSGPMLSAIAGGVFILPFFLFSATAGQLADKVEKSRLTRAVKVAEVIVMGLGAWAVIATNVPAMLGILFLMGTQSALFGPVKYAILPAALADEDLVSANGLVEAGTFLAILIGTIAGGLLAAPDEGPWLVGGTVVVTAILGLIASLFVPATPIAAPDLKLRLNIVAETWSLLAALRESRTLTLSVLGISWFWAVGAVLLSQVPAFTRDVVGGDEAVATLILALFSLGIGAGSLLVSRMMKGEISPTPVPFGALGLAAFAFDLAFAAAGRAPELGAAPLGLSGFMAEPANWRIIADLLGLAICGGLFVVPLYAILQHRAPEDRRSRVIAANNIANAALVVAGAVLSAVALALGAGLAGLFMGMAIASAVVAVIVCGLLPDALFRTILFRLFRLFYRVEIKGLENLKAAGERSVIVVNHVSWLDAPLLAAILPRKPVFAIDTEVARKWWVRPILRVVRAVPVDPTRPMSTKTLVKAVREGNPLIIFPEGRITVTGGLMKVHEGSALIADKAEARVLPIRIEGLQLTPFSKLAGKLPIRLFPKVKVTIFPPQDFDLPDDLKGRARRQAAGIALADIMTDSAFNAAPIDRTLFEALLDAKATNGPTAKILEDIERKPLTYRRLVAGALALGGPLARRTRPGEKVGVLLPTSTGCAVTLMALSATGRVPAMLNFTAGPEAMRAACAAVEAKTVLTSRRFVEAARLTDTVDRLATTIPVVYLEDLRGEIGPVRRLMALLSVPFARLIHAARNVQPTDPAVVLFTSGSEGTPKGVVLSHRNLLANRWQLASCVDFTPADRVFNALPLFHSFGLTGGLLLPLLSGIPTFLYPSPLHYRIVPALAYDTDATILFGTDTFLNGWARTAHPYDFSRLRLVFAGAERVKDETRRTWADRFGVRVLEGYGATETAPVLAVNTPMHSRPGTVGRLLPGIEARLEAVPGIEKGGRLSVRGPNVMLGYLRAENPGVLETPEGGWYDTGDVVSIDDAGFVTIQGRVKRFAKIGGEMVSLTAVEAFIHTVWPDAPAAVIALPDARKGEQIVVLIERPDADRSALLAPAKAAGLTEIQLPRVILHVDKVPVLGTGKTDHVTARAMAERLMDPATVS